MTQAPHKGMTIKHARFKVIIGNYYKHMKTIITLLVVFLMGSATVVAQENKELSGTVKMDVKGLSCPFCAYGLEKNLKKISTIQKLTINVEEAFVILIIEEGKTIAIADLKKKVKDAGFTPGDIKKISNE